MKVLALEVDGIESTLAISIQQRNKFLQIQTIALPIRLSAAVGETNDAPLCQFLFVFMTQVIANKNLAHSRYNRIRRIRCEMVSKLMI